MYKKNNTQWHINTVMSNHGHEPHYVIKRFREDLGRYVTYAHFNSYEKAKEELAHLQSQRA